MKSAPTSPLQKEREVLGSVRGHPLIRQIIDSTDSPPYLILRHLDENLLNAFRNKNLEPSAIKVVARKVLEAVSALHQQGYVHTGGYFPERVAANIRDNQSTYIKPDNILVKYNDGPAQLGEVQLADCGDSSPVDSNADPSEGGHIIGATIFRSQEAMLGLRWKTSTDI